MTPPSLDADLGVEAIPKPLQGEKLVAQFAVERLVGAILPWLPRIDERRLDGGRLEPAQDGTGHELRPVVRPQIARDPVPVHECWCLPSQHL